MTDSHSVELEYSQTPLHGHPLNKDSFLFPRESPCFFSKFTAQYRHRWRGQWTPFSGPQSRFSCKVNLANCLLYCLTLLSTAVCCDTKPFSLKVKKKKKEEKLRVDLMSMFPPLQKRGWIVGDNFRLFWRQSSYAKTIFWLLNQMYHEQLFQDSWVSSWR